ncbi:hypothetical protein NECAME_00707 [Necator americanus]|uniref:Uncharacterized protein n=1 Tax=Necator americanus TaxID=51031 RepID=W2SVE6_NECAM|nr:hypothetical protein NECAME_00707 [Necator americanus]ETN73620.1 hypothetical protein NECAME_00707 [Necator americanus]
MLLCSCVYLLVSFIISVLLKNSIDLSPLLLGSDFCWRNLRGWIGKVEMPRTRSSRAEAAARSISGLLVDIFRANRRQRFSSSSSSEDFVTNSTEDTTSTTTESTSSDTDSDDESGHRNDTKISSRGDELLITPVLEISEEEEVRGDSESIIMDNHDNEDDVQIVEGGAVLPSNAESRNALSDSDSEDIVNRPKRRRTDNFASDDNDEAKPGQVFFLRIWVCD